MFKKKVWKRGDKLNAKELNRIEEEIISLKNSNGIKIIEANIKFDDDDGMAITNINCSVEEFDQLADTNTYTILKLLDDTAESAVFFTNPLMFYKNIETLTNGSFVTFWNHQILYTIHIYKNDQQELFWSVNSSSGVQSLSLISNYEKGQSINSGEGPDIH